MEPACVLRLCLSVHVLEEDIDIGFVQIESAVSLVCVEKDGEISRLSRLQVIATMLKGYRGVQIVPYHGAHIWLLDFPKRAVVERK